MNVAISDSENDKNRPRVSVVMPVHNSGRSNLESAIKSVLGQTLREVELVCVDDASTDCSLAVLREFEGQDRRVRIISFPVNRGTLDARAAAIEAAKGDYITFLDPDDGLAPETCRLLCEVMDGNSWDMVQFGMNLLVENENFTTAKLEKLRQLVSPGARSECSCDEFAQDAFLRCSRSWTVAGKVFRHGPLVSATGSMPRGYCVNGEDGLLLLTFLESSNGRVGILEDKLYDYRLGCGISTTSVCGEIRMCNMIRSAVFANEYLRTRRSRNADAYSRILVGNMVSCLVYCVHPDAMRRQGGADLAYGVPKDDLALAFSDLKISHAFFNRCGLVLRLMMARSPDRRRRLRRRLALARRIAGLERLMLRACKGRRKQKAGMK